MLQLALRLIALDLHANNPHLLFSQVNHSRRVFIIYNNLHAPAQTFRVNLAPLVRC